MDRGVVFLSVTLLGLIGASYLVLQMRYNDDKLHVMQNSGEYYWQGRFLYEPGPDGERVAFIQMHSSGMWWGYSLIPGNDTAPLASEWSRGTIKEVVKALLEQAKCSEPESKQS